MINIIKQKIKNAEGVIEIEGIGIQPAKEVDEKTDPKWSRTILDYQKEISVIDNDYNKKVDRINKNNKLSDNEKRIEMRKASREREKAMIPISENLKSTRKALNNNYEENQRLKFKIFTKDDYNIILKKEAEENSINPDDYDLELKSEEQKLQEAKEKYKEIYTEWFQKKYPSVLVDKEKQNELSQLLGNIDNCDKIEDIKKITI